jgi:hypothetical protein
MHNSYMSSPLSLLWYISALKDQEFGLLTHNLLVFINNKQRVLSFVAYSLKSAMILWVVISKPMKQFSAYTLYLLFFCQAG